jgi:hypothetical protein
MAGGDELRIYVEELAQALQHNTPPPPIPADMPAGARSEIDMLLAGLGMAGNAGDPTDMANAQAGFAQRGQKTGDAMAKFPAGDQDSSKEMQQLLGTFQQIPQQLTQTLSGMFSPFSQGINQAVQSASQIGSQMASTVGKAGQGAGLAGEVPAEALGDGLGAGGAALGAGGAAGGAGAGLAGATIPAGNLGPPPTPSAGTYPASSATPPAVPSGAPDAAAGARGPMGGMPMMPPGAAGGAGGSGSDSKADTKRVVPPSVKNGAPVQGRITTPQSAPEVVKRVAGKPIASRRVLPPDNKPEDDADEIDRNR